MPDPASNADRLNERAVYWIAVRAEGHGPPVAQRLKRALKWLLRSFGLRVVEVGVRERAGSRSS